MLGSKDSFKRVQRPPWDTNSISYLQHWIGKPCFGTDSRNVLATSYCALPRLLSLKFNVVLSDTAMLVICNVLDEHKLLKESIINQSPHNHTSHSVNNSLIMVERCCTDK